MGEDFWSQNLLSCCRFCDDIGDKGMKHYSKALQSCKGLAAVFVACGHFLGFTGQFTLAYILMCDFFFICSGITTGASIANYNQEASYAKHMILKKIKNIWIPYVVIALFQLGAIYIGNDTEDVNLLYVLLVIMLLQCMGFMSNGQKILNASPIGISWYLSVDLWGGDYLFLHNLFAEEKKRDKNIFGNSNDSGVLEYLGEYIPQLYGYSLCKNHAGQFDVDICFG